MSARVLGVALDQVVRSVGGSPVARLERKEVDADSAGAAIRAVGADQTLTGVLGLILRRGQDSELVLAANAVEVRRCWSRGVDGTFDALRELVGVALSAWLVGRRGFVEARCANYAAAALKREAGRT